MITKNMPQLTLPSKSAKGTTAHLNLDNKTQNCRGIIVSREGTKDSKIRKDFEQKNCRVSLCRAKRLIIVLREGKA